MAMRSTRSSLVITSNRMPDPDARAQPVGGLVSALLPAIEAEGGATWFGWDGRSGRERGARVVRARTGSIDTCSIALPGALVDRSYNGHCNGALWPILHSFPGRLEADARDHDAYRAVNETFARAMRRRLRDVDRVWVHDFHLFPLARELRALGFRGRIGFFLHVPFPPPEVLVLFPWARQLLDDLAAYDLVGFHVPEYAASYARACEQEEARVAPHVGVYPIGIDPAPYDAWSRDDASLIRGRELRMALHGRKVVLGVDRLDYTKGIPERLRIFAKLLERHPEWRRKVSFIQISAPSRTRVAEYVRMRRSVEEMVGNLNGTYGDPDWVPVRYLFQAYDQRTLAAFYREADVALVTPLRDGMNLVAKEFVAAQTGDPGVLVLSRFAGAAVELDQALIVNPYDADGSADVLARALELPLEERVARQAALIAKVRAQTAAAWSSAFLRDLDQVKRAGRAGRRAPVRAARPPAGARSARGRRARCDSRGAP
jgi:trehalose 6-phosphate synthase